jgi:predicted Zn-dependent peptidase
MTNPLNSLPGPEDIYREVLPNGITVLARSNFNSPSVVISGYFDAGARRNWGWQSIRLRR